MNTSTPRKRRAAAKGVHSMDTPQTHSDLVQIRLRTSIRDALSVEAAKVGCSPNHCAKLLLEYALKALQDGQIHLVEPQWEGGNAK